MVPYSLRMATMKRAPSDPSSMVRPRRRSTLGTIGAFLRRWTIPIIGGVTPVGLILINVAVWINDHLQTLRWVIAVAAFLSGMILNSWWVLQVYRWVQQRWPHWSVVDHRNQEMALVGGMAGVTVFSFLSALFCYIGLGDTRNLPNRATFLYGAFQIALPFVAKVYFEFAERRAVVKRRHDEGQGTEWAQAPRPAAGASLSAGTPPPPRSALGSSWAPPAPPPASPSRSFGPPGSLPPS